MLSESTTKAPLPSQEQNVWQSIEHSKRSYVQKKKNGLVTGELTKSGWKILTRKEKMEAKMTVETKPISRWAHVSNYSSVAEGSKQNKEESCTCLKVRVNSESISSHKVRGWDSLEPPKMLFLADPKNEESCSCSSRSLLEPLKAFRMASMFTTVCRCTKLQGSWICKAVAKPRMYEEESNHYTYSF